VQKLDEAVVAMRTARRMRFADLERKWRSGPKRRSIYFG
jgi:ribosomal protein L39E